ncbi:MAG: hypothetical protein SFV32_07925 [Opitutaceae bacterium]|nr:hypothetical protein [Opitutaceae bacterium]
MTFLLRPFLLLALAFAALLQANGRDVVDTLPLEDIRPGQMGTVWTVFQGVEPEPFYVRVVGVLQNALGPGRALIICELTDPRVQKMGAVAGMSGSPLYINGRYAGALSYQLQRFETVRHAGFTPVKDLLEVNGAPLSNAPLSSRGNTNGPEPVATPLSVTGLSSDVTAEFKDELESLGVVLAPVGGSASGKGSLSRPLRPGSPVAVALAVGDVSIAATGTVSWVDQDRIIAFGHPMLGLGKTELPLAHAEIVTILPSLQNSFKIANTGALIGTLTEDRLSGIAGTLGPVPRMIPVTVRAPERTLNYQVVRHDRLTPMICAASVMQAVRGSNAHGQTEALKVTAKFRFEGAPELVLENWYSGQDALQGAASTLLARLALPLQGPFRGLLPESIDVEVERVFHDASLTLDTVQADTYQPIAGDTVRIALGTRGTEGSTPSAEVEIHVPGDWAGRKLDLVVTTGPMLDRLSGRADAVPPSQIRDLESLVSWQNDNRREDGVYVAVVERSEALLDETEVWEQAPGSIERIARKADDARFAKREILVPLWSQHVLEGHLVDALVRRPFQVNE